MAKIDERTVSKTRDIEQRQESREDAAERANERTSANLDAAEDNNEVASDMADVKESRATYESDVKARWETIGVRIHAAEQKMSTMNQKASAKLTTELKSLATEHERLKSDVQNVPNIPASSWEKATDKLDERLGKLNERVKDLTDSIEDA